MSAFLYLGLILHKLPGGKVDFKQHYDQTGVVHMRLIFTTSWSIT